MRVDIADVKQAASGRWLSLLGTIAPSLSHALAKPGRHVSCPVHGGSDGFRLFRDAAHTGGGVCNTCGTFADGFDILSWVLGWPLPEAITAVATELGMAQGGPPNYRNLPPPPPVYKGPDPEQTKQRLRELWAQAIPVESPDAYPLHLYLKRRGLTIQLLEGVKGVRFHPSLPYWQEGRNGIFEKVGNFPAMLAMILDREGKPASLHRTYITPEGHKANVESAKKITQSHMNIIGGCIPMGPVQETIDIAEGIETSLAVKRVMGVDVWPVISGSLMASFVPPRGVRSVVVWADKDRSEAGMIAAKALKMRLWQIGIRCAIFVPSQEIPAGAKGLDWNDVLLQYGPDGFPNGRRMAA